jgi:prepilin-type N-terminal cleavage/methylation domain-containing protein
MQDGFTLIELLVVVAIIGILAAIAIPAFSAYRARRLRRASLAGPQQPAKAEEAYFSTHGRYTTDMTQLPPYYPPNGVVPGGRRGTTRTSPRRRTIRGERRSLGLGPGGLQP